MCSLSYEEPQKQRARTIMLLFKVIQKLQASQLVSHLHGPSATTPHLCANQGQRLGRKGKINSNWTDQNTTVLFSISVL